MVHEADALAMMRLGFVMHPGVRRGVVTGDVVMLDGVVARGVVRGMAMVDRVMPAMRRVMVSDVVVRDVMVVVMVNGMRRGGAGERCGGSERDCRKKSLHGLSPRSNAVAAAGAGWRASRRARPMAGVRPGLKVRPAVAPPCLSA